MVQDRATLTMADQ